MADEDIPGTQCRVKHQLPNLIYIAKLIRKWFFFPPEKNTQGNRIRKFKGLKITSENMLPYLFCQFLR